MTLGQGLGLGLFGIHPLAQGFGLPYSAAQLRQANALQREFLQAQQNLPRQAHERSRYGKPGRRSFYLDGYSRDEQRRLFNCTVRIKG